MEKFQKRLTWPSHWPWRGRTVQGREETEWPAHSYNTPTGGEGLRRAKASCQAGPAAQFSSCSQVMLFHGAAWIPSPLSSERAFLGVVAHLQLCRWQSASRKARPEDEGEEKESKGLHLASWPGNVSPASLLHCKGLLDSCLQYSDKNLNSFPLDGIRIWSVVSLSPTFILTHQLAQVSRSHKTIIKVRYIIII